MLAQKISFFFPNYYALYISFLLFLSFRNSKTFEASNDEWTEVKLDEIEKWNKVGEASITQELDGNITLEFESSEDDSAGAIWHKYNFANKTGLTGLNISFQPAIEVDSGIFSTTYPEGFAIVFTSSSTDNLKGDGGSGLGYNGIKNAVVFEFDLSSEIIHFDSLKPHFSVHYNLDGEVSCNSLLCISLCNKNLPNFYDSSSRNYIENTVFEISIIGNVLNVKTNNDEFLLENEDLAEFQELLKQEEVYFGVTAGLNENTKVIINNLKIFETSSIIENSKPNCNILNYLSLKCIKNKVNSVIKETFIDNLFDDLKNKSFSSLLEEVINEEKKDITTIFNNTKYQITSSFNQMSKIYEGISNINLNFCENKLKELNIIDKNDTLLIFKVDYYLRNIPLVKYEIFHPITKNLLNLNLCKSIKVNISYEASIDEDNIYKYDPLDEFYNDICSSYTSGNGTDMTLYDRKNEFNNNNLSLCSKDCEFKEYNTSTKKVTCECEIQNDYSSLEAFIDNVDKSEFFFKFIDIKKTINIFVVKCYKLLFSKEGIIYNIGNYILISIIILFLASTIFFWIKGYDILIEQINEIIAAKKVKFLRQKKKKNKKNKKNKKINKSNKEKKDGKINITENIKKNKCDNANNSIKIENSDDNKSEILKFHTSSIKIKMELNNELNSKINLQNDKEKDIAPVTDKSQKNIQNLSIKKILKSKTINFNDTEMNSFSYQQALKYDNRTYLNYYFSLLKSKNLLIFSFYPNNDYNSTIIKIDLFFFCFGLQYTVNALFFNDSTMHKIYEDNGIFNLAYQINQIIYSTIISIIITQIVKFLSLTEKNVIKMKNEKIDNLDVVIQAFLKCLMIKFILFYSISFIFLFLFWYYLSCFCAVYKNTQIYLIKDTLISFGLSLVYPLFINLIPGIFRISSLKKKNKKILYQISKVIQII